MEELLARYAKIPERVRYSIGAAILIGLIFAFAFTIHLSQDAKMAELEEEFRKLEAERTEKRAYAENLARYEARLNELQQSLNTARAMLPDSADVPQFLAQLGNNARQAGLTINRFEPKAEDEQDFFAEINFDMEVQGSYHEIATFIDSVGKLDRIVNVVDISMRDPKTENQKVVVVSSFTVKTYRFLSEGGQTGGAKKKAKKK